MVDSVLLDDAVPLVIGAVGFDLTDDSVDVIGATWDAGLPVANLESLAAVSAAEEAAAPPSAGIPEEPDVPEEAPEEPGVPEEAPVETGAPEEAPEEPGVPKEAPEEAPDETTDREPVEYG